MTAPFPVPPKCALDAETDQMLAAFRDKADELANTFEDDVAAAIADMIREQFGPGHGRVLVAVAQAAGCFEKVLREDYGTEWAAVSVLAVLALAGSRLDREVPK